MHSSYTYSFLLPSKPSKPLPISSPSMAIWSFDLPRLTDRHVVNIPIYRPGETSEIAEMAEGFGNDSDMESVMNFNKGGEGVFAVASTTHSLKLLVEFLASPTVNIPVRALDIGTITPLEIKKFCKMSEGKRHFSTILAFDVDVTPEASQLAEGLQVKVICGLELETLCQQFKQHVKELEQEETKLDEEAILPSILRILPDLVFSKENPFVVGVLVVKGFVKVGLPICSLGSACLDVGRIAWIEKDHEPVEVANLGETVMIKIVASNPDDLGPSFGRHFDINDDILVSRISRGSINALKSSHMDLLSFSEWKFVADLKCLFNIK